MSIIAILFPDFALILLGFVIKRTMRWSDEFWPGVDRMVYFILFPALLFYSTSRTPFDFHATGNLLLVSLAACCSGIALGWLAKPLFKSQPMIF
jgi:hypothetical protein